MPKTDAERSREYRNRLKALKPIKKPALSARERCKAYRERKKLKRLQEMHPQADTVVKKLPMSGNERARAYRKRKKIRQMQEIQYNPLLIHTTSDRNVTIPSAYLQIQNNGISANYYSTESSYQVAADVEFVNVKTEPYEDSFGPEITEPHDFQGLNSNLVHINLDICGDQYNMNGDVKIPDIKHDNVANQWDICGCCCSNKPELIAHRYTHTLSTPYTCLICYRLHKDKKSLQKHILSHHQPDTSKCNIFHEQYHDKPYECDICNTKFKRNRTLLRHIQIHSDEKSHQCDIRLRAITGVFIPVRNRSIVASVVSASG